MFCFRFPFHLGNVVHRTFRIDDGPVGTKKDFVLSGRIRSLACDLQPVFRGVGIEADMDVGVFPGDGNHLFVPRVADMDSDQLEVRKIHGDLVRQMGRPTLGNRRCGL